MKSKANPLLPNSRLKPETSSDSPSEKSKGARLHSATTVSIQKNATGNNKRKIRLNVLPSDLPKECLKIRKENSKKINLTS